MFVMLLSLIACGVRGLEDSAADPCASTTPSVEVGNGETAHTAVADGATVTMVHGPQGGWHIWYSFAAYNFGEIVTFDITGFDEVQGEMVVDETTSQALVAGPSACGGTAYGAFGYLPNDDKATADVDESPPALLAGDTMVMGVTVTDLDDASITASDEVTVTLACDAVDVGVYPACG